MSLQTAHRALVEAAFADRTLLSQPDHRYAVEGTITALDRGELRVASPPEDGHEDDDWVTHSWVKQAILLYFAVRKMERFDVGPFEFHDKIPLKKISRPRAFASFRRALCASAPTSNRARS
jgi:2,3,4,5-tetrahydropyridine-2-carboxylate N-succinyltransferase